MQSWSLNTKPTHVDPWAFKAFSPAIIDVYLCALVSLGQRGLRLLMSLSEPAKCANITLSKPGHRSPSTSQAPSEAYHSNFSTLQAQYSPFKLVYQS